MKQAFLRNLRLTARIVSVGLLFNGLLMQPLQANGIEVLNASIGTRDGVNQHVIVQFDLSWNNSFRGKSADPNDVTNWDAAWIFVKWRKTSEPTASWSHGTLAATGHVIPDDVHSGGFAIAYTYSLPSDYKGIFIHRSADGQGNTDLREIQIKWDYGADGLANQDNVDIHVFAIEMVYVPEGSFYLGSGGDGNYSHTSEEYGSFTDGSWTTGNTIPLQITSENTIDMGAAAGKLWGTTPSGSNSGMGPATSLPAGFPKGYAAYYCMKYEISQGQFVDFLNHLDSTQQEYHVVDDHVEGGGQHQIMVGPTATGYTDAYRNAVRCDNPRPAGPTTFYCDLNGNGTGNETDDGINVPCNYMYWSSFAAYLDWAALRPMTELEFEKACRGTESPTANEYAWGSTSIKKGFSPPFYVDNYNLTNKGEDSEYVSDPATGSTGNAVYSSTVAASPNEGPLRTGIFATSSTSRATSGGSYWGIMELTGNLEEYVVSVAKDHATYGRGFGGDHGDGSLYSTGATDMSSWNSLGSGRRGGSFISSDGDIKVSSRRNGSYNQAGNRYAVGGRGVRTAP